MYSHTSVQHPDCVLAIECGYKFRFFGKDAEIASQVLGIFSFPDRNYLTAAVPTVTIDRHVRRLVQAGHKVGVVRQTESAAIKAAGSNRNKPFERKLAAVYTRATLEAGEMAAARPSMAATAGDEERGEGSSSVGVSALGRNSEAAWGSEHRSSFLICVIEEPRGDSGKGGQGSGVSTQNHQTLGIVAIETSTGEVYYSQFSDSPMRAELESRLMFTSPSEMLLVTPLSSPTRRLLEAYGGSAVGAGVAVTDQSLTPGSAEIPTAATAAAAAGGILTKIVDGAMYRSGGALSAVTDFYKAVPSSSASPDQIQGRKHESGLDSVLKLPPLVLRALAHALDYLKPFGLEAVLRQGASFREFSEVQELALSPNALAQLEILKNSDDGKERGSLLWLMDRTLTAAGSRQVRRWVSRPLRDVSAIEARLDAVEELLKKGADHPVLSVLPSVLKELPDVERILGRVLHRTSSPPEFVSLLQVFKDLYMRLGLEADLDALRAAVTQQTQQHASISSFLQSPSNKVDDRSAAALSLPLVNVSGLDSQLLIRELAAAADLRCAAAAQATLASLNLDAAAAGDKLRLFSDDQRFPDVAEKRETVIACEAALEALRPELAKTLNLRSVSYTSIANQGDYLVEIPIELEKRAPKTWERVSSTKKMARFRPGEVKRALTALELAREHLALTANAAWVRLQTEFSTHYAAFRGAVRALATLDCLNGFAGLAAGGSYVRPEFVDNSAPPQLHITAGRHPVLDVLLEGSFVPNDIHLSGADGTHPAAATTTPEEPSFIETGPSDVSAFTPEAERCAVVTGPNMGGKSCYIRQAALIVCMAQAGSFVPAAACRLHAFDAVFTRMGAADNLALGRSTFLEELGEASTILAHATPRSLVIIDELGRGTSTRDGRAIAASTLEYLCSSLRCLTLFVTHYPEVARVGMGVERGIGSYYMAHVVEKEAEEGVVPRVIFLYKAVRGVAEASYGLNVARMAGLPDKVVARAAEKAHELAAAAGGGSSDGRRESLDKMVCSVAAGLRRIARGDGETNAQKVVNELQKQVADSLN